MHRPQTRKAAQHSSQEPLRSGQKRGGLRAAGTQLQSGPVRRQQDQQLAGQPSREGDEELPAVHGHLAPFAAQLRQHLDLQLAQYAGRQPVARVGEAHAVAHGRASGVVGPVLRPHHVRGVGLVRLEQQRGPPATQTAIGAVGVGQAAVGEHRHDHVQLPLAGTTCIAARTVTAWSRMS